VSAARNAEAIPMAATGPRLLLEARSDRVRHSSPAITVPALAAIGSMVARTARRIAVQVVGVCRSSSRYRATSSSA
jgi:hypothetical protein